VRAVQDRNPRGMGHILIRPPATPRQRVNFSRPTVDTTGTDAPAYRSDKHRLPASLTPVISPRHSKPKVPPDPSLGMRTGLVVELHTRMKGPDDWQRFTRLHGTYLRHLHCYPQANCDPWATLHPPRTVHLGFASSAPLFLQDPSCWVPSHFLL
jgi:hypothetical protein